MRKNKLYIVLVILTITFLFATAAVCTQCGVLGDEGEEAGDADDNRKSADADDSGKEGESKDTNGDKNDSDKKDEPKPEDKKSDDENKQPVIAGIYLDVLDPVHYKVTPIVKTKYRLSYSYTSILETVRSLPKYISAGGEYPKLECSLSLL